MFEIWGSSTEQICRVRDRAHHRGLVNQAKDVALGRLSLYDKALHWENEGGPRTHTGTWKVNFGGV